MNVLETKETTINDNYYVITAMPADQGMDFLDQMIQGGGKAPTKEMKQIIIKYVKLGGKAFTDKTYGTHFSRNYNELNQLFEEVMEFNFGEADPKVGDDTSEEGDTSDS